jgi:hypothetical protein
MKTCNRMAQIKDLFNMIGPCEAALWADLHTPCSFVVSFPSLSLSMIRENSNMQTAVSFRDTVTR